MISTESHSETNGHPKTYTRTIGTLLRQNVHEDQNDWDVLSKPFTYYYNARVHLWTSVSASGLNLTEKPPSPSVTGLASAILNNASKTILAPMLEQRINVGTENSGTPHKNENSDELDDLDGLRGSSIG